MIKQYLKRMKGYEHCPARKPFNDIIWSWLGAFTGIYLISIFHNLINMDMLDSLFLLGSFGASAVLIYGAPKADFSQPRNLIGGHIISAIIGITVYKYISLDIAILGSLAVSLSLAAMHLTRTLHPPGGATALTAVIGSDTIHDLGYMYVLSPVTISAFIMLTVGLFINNLSNNPKRHYPRYWL